MKQIYYASFFFLKDKLPPCFHFTKNIFFKIGVIFMYVFVGMNATQVLVPTEARGDCYLPQRSRWLWAAWNVKSWCLWRPEETVISPGDPDGCELPGMWARKPLESSAGNSTSQLSHFISAAPTVPSLRKYQSLWNLRTMTISIRSHCRYIMSS